MASVIAAIWDFDKTLVNGYMQDPIFEQYPYQFTTHQKQELSLKLTKAFPNILKSM